MKGIVIIPGISGIDVCNQANSSLHGSVVMCHHASVINQALKPALSRSLHMDITDGCHAALHARVRTYLCVSMGFFVDATRSLSHHLSSNVTYNIRIPTRYQTNRCLLRMLTYYTFYCNIISYNFELSLCVLSQQCTAIDNCCAKVLLRDNVQVKLLIVLDTLQVIEWVYPVTDVCLVFRVRASSPGKLALIHLLSISLIINCHPDKNNTACLL